MNAAANNAKAREASNANYRPVIAKHQQLASLVEDRRAHYNILVKVVRCW